MHFKELFKMSLLQTDCRSLFTAMQRAALSFGVIVFSQFLSAAVNILGSWLTFPLSVRFTDMGRRPGGSSGKSTGPVCQERPSLTSIQRTILLQRCKWVSAISADLRV